MLKLLSVLNIIHSLQVLIGQEIHNIFRVTVELMNIYSIVPALDSSFQEELLNLKMKSGLHSVVN